MRCGPVASTPRIVVIRGRCYTRSIWRVTGGGAHLVRWPCDRQTYSFDTFSKFSYLMGDTRKVALTDAESGRLPRQCSLTLPVESPSAIRPSDTTVVMAIAALLCGAACSMCVGGLPEEQPDHTVRVALFAIKAVKPHRRSAKRKPLGRGIAHLAADISHLHFRCTVRFRTGLD